MTERIRKYLLNSIKILITLQKLLRKLNSSLKLMELLSSKLEYLNITPDSIFKNWDLEVGYKDSTDRWLSISGNSD